MASVVIIREDLLDSLLEASKRKHPLEFFAFLGGTEEKDVLFITEVIYVPWREGVGFAEVHTEFLPPNQAIGTFHSHPGPPKPSSEDISSFFHLGKVHIIAGYPFSRKNVRAYDSRGREIKLVVVSEPVFNHLSFDVGFIIPDLDR